ncbi:MAG: carboxymuconolactone decarboxylase family protein [Bacteroidales bacterium]
MKKTVLLLAVIVLALLLASNSCQETAKTESNQIKPMEKVLNVNPYQDARIQPLPMSDMPGGWVSTIERLPGAGLKGRYAPVNVFGTMIHSPQVPGPFLDYWVTSKLVMGLTGREQELVILRMGFHYKSNYVWKHHVPPAKEYGVTDAEIEAVKTPELPPVFSDRERALLMLTDEMVDHRTIRDEAWSKWSPALTESEMIELVFLVSQYVFFGLFNNAFQIQVEEPLAEIPGLDQ